VLFRKADGSVNHEFHGTLPFSWPKSPLQSAVNHNQAGEEPLFAYGYGLRYGTRRNLAPLSEDAGEIPPAIDTQTFFTKGKATSGWKWQDGNASVTPVDFKAQEDGRAIRLPQGSTTPVGLAGDVGIDLTRESNGDISLAFDYRVDEPVTAPVRVSMECGSACSGAVPIHEILQSAPRGEWRHLKILLSCFQKAGTDMSRVTAPFIVSAEGATALSIAEVRLEAGVDDVMACGN
jgi:beta-glucosidase